MDVPTRLHRVIWVENPMVFMVLGLVFLFRADVALAIPSPELVISSVSSLSQVAAVAFAFFSGAAALLARKFGIRIGATAQRSFPVRLILGLLLVICALGAGLLWQTQKSHQTELDRMQATLVRPASFDGTTIKDENLKETSFASQAQNPLGITTQALARLLEGPVSQRPVLYDIRESGENAMGSLPGATHVRYPDFPLQSHALKGKKVVLFCHNGNRSSETCSKLALRGIDCSFVVGGLEKWIVEGRAFSDSSVSKLSDLRPLPAYQNKDTLISSATFKTLMEGGDLQIVDTRYPADFASGHLPGAINIPLRALKTEDLNKQIAMLSSKPTIAACYDRRSCFMSQVLGYEMSRKGLSFLGRYTTPWDYFVPPAQKPHIQAWLRAQNTGMWQQAIVGLSGAMTALSSLIGLGATVFALAFVSRLLVLPIAIKSERDQILTAKHSKSLANLKKKLADDPTRKARAIQQFYRQHGLTPMRNLVALLFLPLMMLGVSASALTGTKLELPFLWSGSSALPDEWFVLPVLFALLGGLYLHLAVAKTKLQKLLWWGLGTPVLFVLVFRLNITATFYLCSALALLLLQRAYVTGFLGAALRMAHSRVVTMVNAFRNPGVIPLQYSDLLKDTGNKSYRLSVMKNAGLPVPTGVVVTTEGLRRFNTMSVQDRDGFSRGIAAMLGGKTCAVRSSAAAEDGADQSFAGIFESVLDVTPSTLQAALETVIGSFSSSRVQSYTDAPEEGHDGNILVQEMIEADYAGVVFTQDPTAPGLTMLELVKGTGDDLVSGRVTPQTFRFGRYTKTRIGTQEPPIDLRPLIALCDQIETLFLHPQDVEWAYKNGTFYIVQSRDITTLNVGSPEQQMCAKEWQRMFSNFGDADADAVILEQDEMSEVLPTPTPASFSLMARMWAPGGSLDLACRDLGVAYNVPEGKTGHLVSLFNKTYVDRRMKDAMALQVSTSKAKALTKAAQAAPTRFENEVLPALKKFLAPWKATDFSKMLLVDLQECLTLFTGKLVQEVYVEAERINILAGFTMVSADNFVRAHPDQKDRLLQGEMVYSPTGILRRCAAMPGDTGRFAALQEMGHRAMFDYELSAPRYRQVPELLWPMLTIAGKVGVSKPTHAGKDDPVALAHSLQDLKERAKHESLWLVALIREVLLAISEHTGLGDLVFYLRLAEIGQAQTDDWANLTQVAQTRKHRSDTLKKMTPRAVELTLHDCELASAPDLAVQQITSGQMSGNCVSGSEVKLGRVFVVHDEETSSAAAFDGFETGNIIVCHMVNPEWLPFILKSNGVLSEVGGWLSHMSIVAREHDTLMLVACRGLEQLVSGQEIIVDPAGTVTIADPELGAVGMAV